MRIVLCGKGVETYQADPVSLSMMNPEQLATQLRAIEDCPVDFSVVFSGKKSKRLNGTYKPGTREIYINDRNFDSDNLLLYTAIHEYAHHLHAILHTNGVLPIRHHSSEFMAILHRLIEKAETKGLYRNVFNDSPELLDLTKVIQSRIATDGEIIKELGELLFNAYELCTNIGGRFEDYLDRIVRIPRLTATTAMKIHQFNLNPSLGSDTLRFLAGIKNEDQRGQAQSELLQGSSIDTVRVKNRKTKTEEPALQTVNRAQLEKEKFRLEQSIELLSKRLEELERILAAPDDHAH
ncbi:MAG: hypothetical protein LBO67_09005 [Spirochaetaceae bacterium]|nr:hypothetical protein [Spirochaetaceae bacterium]